MGALLDTVRTFKADRGEVAVHVNPGMFNPRAVKLAIGDIVPVAIVPSPAEIEAAGATVVNDPAPQLLFDDHIYYSGEIPPHHPFGRKRHRDGVRKPNLRYGNARGTHPYPIPL